MKFLQTVIRENGIRAIVSAEKAIGSHSGAKQPKKLIGKGRIPVMDSKVERIMEDESAVWIAKFDDDGQISEDDFVILAMTDLHFEDDPELRDKTIDMMVRNITDVNPDLVVFTGDIILSNHQQLDGVRFAKLFEDMGVYWTFVFGNHEARAEKEYHKYFLMKNMSQYEHCLAKFGPSELFGYGNHIINIMNRGGSIRQSLFLFDSGRNISDKYRFENGLDSDLRGYDYLKNNQKNWYRNHIEEQRRVYGDFKSLMFMHIPLCEYENVNRLDKFGEYVPTGKAKILYGSQYESIGCSPVNSGMFSLIKELGSTQAVFAGHDHVNDFCAEYDGVKLVYVQTSGYETYTMGDLRKWDESKWMQGATVITVKQDGSIELKQRFNRDYL